VRRSLGRGNRGVSANAELARAAEAEKLLADANNAQQREEANKQLAERAAEVARIRVQLEHEKEQRLLERIPIIVQSMKVARTKYRYARARQGAVVYVCVTAAAAIGTNVFTDWNPWLGLVSAFLVGGVTILFSSFVFDSRFSKRAIRLRQESFEHSAQSMNFKAELDAYNIDWDRWAVTLKKAPPVELPPTRM